MKVNKVKLLLTIFFILIGFYLFRNRSIDSSKKMELAVLQDLETDFLWRTLRYIPEDVSRRFNFKLFEEKGREKIYCVEYFYKSVFLSFYFGVSEDGDVDIIKNGFIVETKKNYQLSDLITIKTFDKVAKVFDWSELEIKNNFSFFLSSYCDIENSHVLRSLDDYEDIIRLFPIKDRDETVLTNILTEDNIIDVLNSQKNDDFFFWYYDKGLYKFVFNIDNGEVKMIESKFIGNFGNEIGHL
ncbi:hypothetical protein [Algoriphagus litoralis]|uniref:hypothetical protein n=1 Tax=Algoriphagus litoralis TaxID=2202829 RepID=UPI000DB9AE18|nr:hypothetical protein [Algoriphagus litoralis]